MSTGNFRAKVSATLLPEAVTVVGTPDTMRSIFLLFRFHSTMAEEPAASFLAEPSCGIDREYSAADPSWDELK